MGHKYEFETDSGKKIVLSEFKIKTKSLAAKNVYSRGLNGEEALAASEDEVLKLLIVSINGKAPSGIEREDLDSILGFADYQQIMLVIKDMIGADLKKPTVKILTQQSGAE